MPRGAMPMEIMRALSTKEKPVTITEFNEFWDSLTDEERNWWRWEADLSQFQY